ncbi:hypothetical protein H8D36_03790 [archaeon]|nr:hypothetical protein [archaeon]MBL7056951.1 hypothetical protein [Candidatus Woesearchaeota archaeon]
MGGLERIAESWRDWTTNYPKIAAFTTASLSCSFLVGLGALVDANFPRTEGLSGIVSTLLASAVVLPGIAYDRFKSYSYDTTLKKYDLKYYDIKSKLKKTDFVKKKVRNFFTRTLDSFLENPKKTAVALSLGLTSLSLARRVVQDGIERVYHWMDNIEAFLSLDTVILAGSYLIAKVGVGTWGVYIHSSNRKFWSDYKKFKKLSEDVENADLSSLKEIADKSPIDFFVYEYARICFSRGEKYDALDALKMAREKSALNHLFCLEPYVFATTIKGEIYKHDKNIQEDPLSFPDYYGLASQLLKIGERKKAIEVIHKFTLEAEKNSDLAMDANVAEAMFLEGIDATEELDVQALKLLSMSKKFERIGDHEILTMNDTKYSGGAFIFRKSQDRVFLEDEQNFDSDLKTNFDGINTDKEFRIIKPPRILPYNLGFLGMMEIAAGKALYNLLKTRYDVNTQTKISRFMARIHVSNPIYDSESDQYYYSQLKQKIEGVRKKAQNSNSGLLPYLEMIEDNMDILFTGLGNLPRVVNIDGHQFNWIVGKYITKIDNQQHSPVPPCFECSKQIEQSVSPPKSMEGDVIRDTLLLEYHSEFSNVHKLPEIDEFTFYKAKSDVIKAVSNFCYVYDKPQRYMAAGEFLANAIYSMEKLRGYYTSTHDRISLSHLRAGLEGLILSLA